MASREVALAIANGDIGKGENPPGTNKTEFAAIAGHLNGYAWCATWVVSVMRRAGIKLPSESAWTVAMNNGFQGSGAGVANLAGGLQPGDVIFFDFVSPFNSRGIQHVGIFEKYLEPGYIQTIEGNTSSGDSGSQDNGDGVYRRKRPLKFIVAAGRPKYDPSVTAPAPLPAPVGVRPDFDPPLVVEAVSGAGRIGGPGGWLLQKDGAIFSFEAPFYGGANGQPYFVPRQAKRLDAKDNGGYAIIATDDGLPGGSGGYDYPGGGNRVAQGPEFNPPITLRIVSSLSAPQGGFWLLLEDGAVFSFGNAPYGGGVNGKDYFAGRKPAQLEPNGDSYVIIATSGERYDP